MEIRMYFVGGTFPVLIRQHGGAILATLSVLSLLLAFHQVVLSAVQDGASRHKADALRAEAKWRCKALRDPRASASCLLALATAPYNGAQLEADARTPGTAIE
jgi:hypothetical protein